MLHPDQEYTDGAEFSLAFLSHFPVVLLLPTYYGNPLFRRAKRAKWKVVDEVPTCLAVFTCARDGMSFNGMRVVLPGREWRQLTLEQKHSNLPKGTVLQLAWSFMSRSKVTQLLKPTRPIGAPRVSDD